MLNLENIYDVVTKDKTEKMSLRDILSKSKKTILYFYPKDNTPGCTVENIDFSNFLENFKNKGINIFGVSKDSVDSHKKFIEKHCLKVPLISDSDLILHKELGAFGEKNSYGKIVQGVIRSTFLIDENGNILSSWKNVKASGHVEKVLKEID